MSFSKKISPLNIDSFSSLLGRGEDILFYQGGFSESWRNCIFSKCRYELISFTDSEIIAVSFNSSEFHKTNFKNTILNHVAFNSCTLVSTNFDYLKMENSSFQNCLIDNCSFNKAQLNFTNFYLSELSYCKFQGADLSNTNLNQAKSLLGCEFDQFTKLPFSESEAYSKGMIYAPQLVLVTEEIKLVNNIISFPEGKKNHSSFSGNNAKVIDFVDYVKLKKLTNEGPQSA